MNHFPLPAMHQQKHLMNASKFVAGVLVFVGMGGSLALAQNPDLVLDDFEGTNYGPWTVTGTAFGIAPAPGTLPGQMPVAGFQIVQSDQRSTASIVQRNVTRDIQVEKPYLNFPVKNGGPICRVSLLRNGVEARAFDMELADGKPDWWA